MTNKEIANLIGVSPATLSLVINNKPGIADTTRHKVLFKLREHGFTDLIKNANNDSSMQNIGFIVFKKNGQVLDQSPFFMLILDSMSMTARKNGYNLLYQYIDCRTPLEEQLNNLTQMNLCGLIIFATEMQLSDLHYFDKMQIPRVMLANSFPKANVDCVSINNLLGAYQAIEYLFKMGHRNIGYLKCKTDENCFSERDSGYKDAVKNLGLKLLPENIFELSFSEEKSYIEFREILSHNRKLPTAFVADDDIMAAGVMKALKEYNITVPEDVSIIGFCDRPLCRMVDPPLTTIQIPRYSYGSMAVELLLVRIRNKEMKEENNHSIKLQLGTELVERNSVISKN